MAPVYNLTVEGEHEYYADGILVSNCDGMRYVGKWVDTYRSAGSDDAYSAPGGDDYNPRLRPRGTIR